MKKVIFILVPFSLAACANQEPVNTPDMNVSNYEVTNINSGTGGHGVEDIQPN